MTLPWLTILWLIPAAASVAVIAVPVQQTAVAKWLALGSSLATAVWAIAIAIRFSAGGERFQLVENVS